MDLGAIFLTLAVTILVALFLARPFLMRSRAKIVSAEEHELSSLMAERDRMITSLQELDFDHTLGKIPSEDYPIQRAELLKRAADVMRRLDELQPNAGPDDNAESRIEAVVAARRADAAIPAKDSEDVSDEELEAIISARRAEHKEKSGGFCPHCGKPVLRSDRFCPACGKSTK